MGVRKAGEGSGKKVNLSQDLKGGQAWRNLLLPFGCRGAVTRSLSGKEIITGQRGHHLANGCQKGDG